MNYTMQRFQALTLIKYLKDIIIKSTFVNQNREKKMHMAQFNADKELLIVVIRRTIL